jgi:hypothetical protein
MTVFFVKQEINIERLQIVRAAAGGRGLPRQTPTLPGSE